MKSKMILPNNNSCFKKKKSIKYEKIEIRPAEISFEGDYITIPPDEVLNDVSNSVEKKAPIAAPEEVSLINMEESMVSSDFDTTTESIIEGSNYVLTKVKRNKFGVRWSNLTDVIHSDVKETLPSREIFLQEAMFEVISSEAKYFSGLDIMVNHFKNSYLFSPVNDKVGYVNPIDKFHVFSNISNIMETSRRLLNDLEIRWIKDKPILKDVCDILYTHASSNSFYNYVIYISNQRHQMQEFERLMETDFIKTELIRLESFDISKNLPLSSYLLLPFQRLTRLKLLAENILKGLTREDMNQNRYSSQIKSAKMSIRQLEHLLMVSQKSRVDRDLKELVLDLRLKIDFQNYCKQIDIGTKRLLREGDFESVPLKKESKSKKKNQIFVLLLFDDIMMIGKRNGSRLLILDYCPNKDVVLTNIVKVKKKSKKKVEETNEEIMKITLMFKKSCSGVLNEPITLTSNRSGLFDQWKHCLPELKEPEKKEKLSIGNEPQWQSVKRSIVRLNV